MFAGVTSTIHIFIPLHSPLHVCLVLCFSVRTPHARVILNPPICPVVDCCHLRRPSLSCCLLHDVFEITSSPLAKGHLREEARHIRKLS